MFVPKVVLHEIAMVVKTPTEMSIRMAVPSNR
jgi:hypothetical protein